MIQSFPDSKSSVVAMAAWHGLGWLAVANIIGVWLAILLLYPVAGNWLGEWSYGRWVPVHLNFQLYGWISLPLVGWLLRVYHVDRLLTAAWGRAALWMWSLALMVGAFSWLSGHSSGKIFLDWTGYARVFFPLTILFLWIVLAVAFTTSRRLPGNASLTIRTAKTLGLAALLPIPFVIYLASNPSIYPPVNPDSGGPTGASQLESALVVVFLLLLLPYGISKRNRSGKNWIVAGWVMLALELVLCLGLGRENVSHHRPTQFVSLGSLLVWVALIPGYYSAFFWNENTRRWRMAVLFWWAVLIPTGWCLFLPGVLDHLKFTDGLVGHSLMAMAGFVTSLLILLLVALLGDDGDVFNSRWAFVLWQGGTAAYAAIMFFAGWIEGADPTFTMVPSTTRNLIYLVRLSLGLAMTAASCNWLLRLTLRMNGEAARKPERSGQRRSGQAGCSKYRATTGECMKPTRQLWLVLYQYGAGLCDTGTGLLMLLAPAWTLHLMGIKIIPTPDVFASFIGVFVLGVGLTYLWTAVRSSAQDAMWRTQWLLTALIRTLVALFVFGEITLGRMEPAWITVALSDGVLATMQWLGLSKGWLDFAER